MVVNQVETQEALQQMETLLLPEALQANKWEWTWTNHRRLQKREIPNKKTGMRMNECCLTHLILPTHILFCYLNNTLDAVVHYMRFEKVTSTYNGRRVEENIIKVHLLKFFLQSTIINQ